MRKNRGRMTLKAWQRAVSEYDLIMRALAADAPPTPPGSQNVNFYLRTFADPPPYPAGNRNEINWQKGKWWAVTASHYLLELAPYQQVRGFMVALKSLRNFERPPHLFTA